MREVDVDAKVLADVNRLEPAAHSFKAGNPRADGIERHAQRKAHAGRTKGVVDVEAGTHVKRDLPLADPRLRPEPRTRAGHARGGRSQVRDRRLTVAPESR